MTPDDLIAIQPPGAVRDELERLRAELIQGRAVVAGLMRRNAELTRERDAARACAEQAKQHLADAAHWWEAYVGETDLIDREWIGEAIYAARAALEKTT